MTNVTFLHVSSPPVSVTVVLSVKSVLLFVSECSHSAPGTAPLNTAAAFHMKTLSSLSSGSL